MNLENLISPLVEKLPATAKLKLFGLAKIPLLFATNPKVVKLDDSTAEVEIPLNYFTKNHVGCMYFGALSIGADCVVAMHALQIARSFPGYTVTPIFKDFRADFYKRAEDDVLFVCTEGEKIKQMVELAISSGERVTDSITATAYTPNLGSDPVAQFTLGLSLKAKK